MKPKEHVKYHGKNLKVPTAKTASSHRSSRRMIYQNEYFLVLLFLIIGFFCYLPTLRCDFIPSWDDNAYITDNLLIRNLSLTTIKQMFTSQVGGTYVPIPMLSFAIEYKLWGLNPLPFHFTNVLLHLLCTYLVFRILRLLKIKLVYAAAAAMIYGVHPMGVESVAWATERKDILYTFFYFASLMLYIHYVQAKSFKRWFFISSLGLFLLALFSKIQAVSLPLALLLVDYYFSRTDWRKMILEKVPFFILSLAFGIAGIFILRNIGALKVNEIFSLSERIFMGSYALCAYIFKFFVPTGLSALYPYPGPSGQALPLLYYLSPIFIVIIITFISLTVRKIKPVVFGLLFFLCSVIFMLQIFGAGQGFLADRFTKVPYLGFVFLVGWAMESFNSKYKSKALLTWLICVGYTLFFMGSTYNRCKVWKNGETLWTDVIEKFPVKDSRPYSCRGVYYRTEKDNDKALADFNTSLSLNKDDLEIRLLRGNIYFERGMDDSAYSDYNIILKLNMENSLALSNMGAIYVRRKQFDSAVTYLSSSIRLDSSSAVTFANRAVAFGSLGRTEESIADFKHYLAIKPNDERVFMSIAVAYQKLGNYQESLEWMDKAIVNKPTFGNYYFLRSQSYKLMGNRVKALTDGLKALELGFKVPPDYIQSLR